MQVAVEMYNNSELGPVIFLREAGGKLEGVGAGGGTPVSGGVYPWRCTPQEHLCRGGGGMPIPYYNVSEYQC